MPIDLIRPQALRLSRIRGFNLQVASRALNGLPAKVVARPQLVGNPFRVADPGGSEERAQAAWLYSLALDPRVQLVDRPDLVVWRAKMLRIIPTLRGHNLACWCPLPIEEHLPDCCHRSVLLPLANPAFPWPVMPWNRPRPGAIELPATPGNFYGRGWGDTPPFRGGTGGATPVAGGRSPGVFLAPGEGGDHPRPGRKRGGAR